MIHSNEMAPFFVSALQRLVVQEPAAFDLPLAHDLFLTNDLHRVESLFTAEFQTIVGCLEADFLRRATTLLYRSFEEPFASDDKAMEALNDQIDLSHVLMTSLWFVKDNAVTFNSVFLVSRVVATDGLYRATSKQCCTPQHLAHLATLRFPLTNSRQPQQPFPP